MVMAVMVMAVMVMAVMVMVTVITTAIIMAVTGTTDAIGAMASALVGDGHPMAMFGFAVTKD
jgi:hypothetical protein